MIVVFDLDGTLIDAAKLHSEILFELLGERIQPNEIYKSSSLRFLLMENLPKKRWSSIKDITRKHEAELLKRIELIEPMPGLYKMLEKVNLKKVIFTSATKKLCNAMTKYCMIKGYFEMVVTSNDVGREKPDPEGLFKISEELKDSSLVFIGNSEKDLLAAKKFGAISVLFNPKNNVKAVSDFEVTNLNEIPDLIDSLS